MRMPNISRVKSNRLNWHNEIKIRVMSLHCQSHIASRNRLIAVRDQSNPINRHRIRERESVCVCVCVCVCVHVCTRYMYLDFVKSSSYHAFCFPQSPHLPLPRTLVLAAVEMASLDVAISRHNRGYRLLELMGWKENTALGKHQQGTSFLCLALCCDCIILLTCCFTSLRNHRANPGADQRRRLGIRPACN
jgi:hypothetical protein